MSADGNGDDGDDGFGSGREVAYRLFAAEYDDASLSYAESDEERAPNYVIAPTGARINRLFAVGTLTEISSVNDEMLRARVVDPTGAFVVYAGQYQPDELAFLERADPPLFVAVTGKARTFEPEDGDRVYTSIRPESIATVDAETRDRWVVSTAEQTVERIGAYAAAAELDVYGDDLTDALLEAGLDEGLAAGIPLAQDHYGTTPAYLEALRDLSIDAVRVVAGERDEVGSFDVRPDAAGDGTATFAGLAETADVTVDAAALEAESADATTSGPDVGPSDAETGSAADAPAASGSATGTAATSGNGTDSSPDPADADETPAAQSVTATTNGDAATDGATATEEVASSEDVTATDDVTPTADATTDDATTTDETPTDAGLEAAADDAGDDAVEATDDEDDELGDFQSGGLGDEMYEMDEAEREELEEEFGTEFTTGSDVDEPGEAGIDVPQPGDESADDESAGDEPGDGESVDDELEGEGDETEGEAPAAAESESEVAEAGATEADHETEADESEIEASGGDETAETSEEPDVAADAGADDELEDADEGDSSAEPDESEPESGDGEAEPEADDADSDDGDAEPAEDVDLQAYVVETMRELDDGSGADRATVLETVADDTGADPAEVEDAVQDALMGGQCYEPDDETLKAI